MTLSHTIHVRFYGDLGNLLSRQRRGKRFAYVIKGCPSVKDTLEALGVPHVLIDAIFVNHLSCYFSYQLTRGDNVKVYPAHYVLKNKKAIHLIDPLPTLRFVVDSHLGKLARRLRLLGFDTVYKTMFPDKDIVLLSCRQRRIVLTRDKGLLKYRYLRWGHWVHATDPAKQIKEVVKKYSLMKYVRPFSRCMECNGRLERVPKSQIISRLPAKTKLYYKCFYRCQRCCHIYWKGSHYALLNAFIARLRPQDAR